MKLLKSNLFLTLLFFIFMGCPKADTDSILTFGNESLVIEGTNFGDNPRPIHDYLVKAKNGIKTVVDSHDPQILIWSDSLIKFQDSIAPDESYTLFVVREFGKFVSHSKPIKVEVYEYTNYSMLGGCPINLEFDQEGTLWITSEFSTSIYSLALLSNSVIAHQVPQPPEYIFAQDWFPSRLSGLSEDVLVDSDGNIWFTQGGGYLYKGGYINASRIVKYTPSSETFLCYNIPSNNAEIFGLYFEEDIGRIWVAAGGNIGGNFIASFFPEAFSLPQTSCLYNFQDPFLANYCESGEVNGCFVRHDMLTQSTNPAHLSKTTDGHIWVSQFFGNSISELNSGNNNLMEYLMPESSGTSYQALVLGSGPWSLVFDDNKLWILEDFDSQIVEFDVNTKQILKEYTIPVNTKYEFAHTMILDKSKNLWFSIDTTPKTEGFGQLGRLTSKSKFEMFPPLKNLGILKGGITGLAIEENSGDIYFGEFWRARIGRLHRLD